MTLTVHNLLFHRQMLWLSDWTLAFYWLNFWYMQKLFCLCTVTVEKYEQKDRTIELAGFHNHSRLLTMVEPTSINAKFCSRLICAAMTGLPGAVFKLASCILALKKSIIRACKELFISMKMNVRHVDTILMHLLVLSHREREDCKRNYSTCACTSI